MIPEPHEVTVLCRCEDIDWCIVGQLIADVRYLYFEAQRRRTRPAEPAGLSHV